MNEESKQDYGTLVAKKSEKLVTALYLVTDLMSSNEPIKHGLRKNAVALLSSMNALSQLDVKDRVIEFKMSLKMVTEIISLLHVAVTTGIVSDMNGQLLMKGFRALQLILEKRQPIFTEAMLDIEDEALLREEKGFSSAVGTSSYDVLTPLSLARLHDGVADLRRTQESLKQSHLLSRLEKGKQKTNSTTVEDKGHTDSRSATADQQSKENRSTYRDIMEHSSVKETTKEPSVLASSFQMKKQSRRDQILALFVKDVDVSIKDISLRIRGCSEKTIQRELNALLYDNLIERIGEKRWSRYVLK